ncbi:FAD-binding oxidoreductase [Phenylobacterium sp.]|uniref:FAD-binding oxidoreductase n=1 Tax=Phenylobacterium sp. TaxID=1871053 RepID=UPI0011FD4433|nr:FAD-dependent oxidoreductase [Phenylobacterium sp.]THD61064.1 MAG: FAD-binding oxidoreductase [Phenylobacterium sp.]
MTRRQFLGASLALAAAGALHVPAARAAGGAGRARPGAAGWPGEGDWAGLKQAVGGRLAPVTAPDVNDPAVRELMKNPFYVGDQPGLTQSSGWLEAWQSSPSVYAVSAESAADVVAAVRFARAHNLRLVVRGGGHSYLGASNAPDSLMLWTRRMREVTVHEGFTPKGSSAAPVAAVTAGAGCIWLDAYQAVTTGAGRYVQGGGCTTVGIAGLVQGGGFGSHSKGFGTAAGGLLEAEVVTADGQVHVVNHAREPDLFWALKGGGGGTFGIITRLTLATHPLPETFGAVRLSIHAKSDEAFRRLIGRFVELYAANLFNPHWGEQVRIGSNNRLDVQMVFQGLTGAEARAAWAPLVAFADASPDDYEGQKGLLALPLPARKFWDAEFMKNAPGAITLDQRPGAPAGRFWWTGDGDQVGAFWHAYESVWLPSSLLQPEGRGKLADALFAASRTWGLSLHFNKGLAGAPPEALAAARDTATNPEVLDAFALVIMGAAGPAAYRGMASGEGPLASVNRAKVTKAMAALRVCAPGAGAYVNECSYFQPDWQQAFWGPNYTRLQRIKRRYDPSGLFTVHHGVGSEGWSADGFTRTA